MDAKISAMFDGLGLNPQDIIGLAEQEVSPVAIHQALSPFPIAGRYGRYIPFMQEHTSLMAWSKYRIFVIVEQFIALADTMAGHSGELKNPKIILFSLTQETKEALRAIAENLTFQQIAQIKFIESKSDHDLAAITDWLKFEIDRLGILASVATDSSSGKYLDAFHLGRTSEDVNSPVFALVNRDIFFMHLLPTIIALQEAIIQFACENDKVAPGLTHGQPAEPTTTSKQFMNTVAAIDQVLLEVFLPYNAVGKRGTISFPVKTFGAVGNHSDLGAVYPEIDWILNDKRFVAALGPGLHLDTMVMQASMFGGYKIIYDAICTIARHILKFANDFWGHVSLQWFKKMAKLGIKGSSVMPNKYNPWRIEGAVAILEKAIVQLEYTSKALMDYRYEGDMRRSILMRDIGDDFAKFFIAFGRIKEELRLYTVHAERIDESLQENPGIAGGAAQTVLKCADVPGDAYRHIQNMMINSDGSYVSGDEFAENVSQAMTDGGAIPSAIGEEILRLANSKNNIGYADRLAREAMHQTQQTISMLKAAYSMPS